MCLHIAMEILGGNIKKKDGYVRTLDEIGLWVDGKLNNNLDGNME